MTEQLILDALREPKDAIFYSFGRALEKLFPEHRMIESTAYSFRPSDYAEEGHCTITTKRAFPSQISEEWHPGMDGLFEMPVNSWQEITWNGEQFDYFLLSIRGQHCPDTRSFLAGKDPAATEKFFITVSKWCTEIRGEVLVFFEGHWSKSKELYESIQSSTLDNLVLPEGMKDSLYRDFAQFFASKVIYERHNIPWKRGALFIGPAGNGKTHTVKALINALKVPCLYVRSFRAQYGSTYSCVSQAFERARQAAPCLLVLEDLDSLVDDRNRSFFLNEMDGFYSNAGILVLATTNHAERLDPAILDRPSRFDRKYTFALPAEKERLAYLRLNNEELESSVRLSANELSEIARATEAFSYAYLKELVLSSLMAWIHNRHLRVKDVMLTQVDSLREQMKTALAAPPIPMGVDFEQLQSHFGPRFFGSTISRLSMGEEEDHLGE